MAEAAFEVPKRVQGIVTALAHLSGRQSSDVAMCILTRLESFGPGGVGKQTWMHHKGQILSAVFGQAPPNNSEATERSMTVGGLVGLYWQHSNKKMYKCDDGELRKLVSVLRTLQGMNMPAAVFLFAHF